MFESYQYAGNYYNAPYYAWTPSESNYPTWTPHPYVDCYDTANYTYEQCDQVANQTTNLDSFSSIPSSEGTFSIESPPNNQQHPEYNANFDLNQEVEITTYKNRNVKNKYEIMCEICGDKSSGFHYGAFTCEACKLFFSRVTQNRRKTHIEECETKQCVISVTNRAVCAECRLAKCLAIGMSKMNSRFGRYGPKNYPSVAEIDPIERLMGQVYDHFDEMFQQPASANDVASSSQDLHINLIHQFFVDCMSFIDASFSDLFRYKFLITNYIQKLFNLKRLLFIFFNDVITTAAPNAPVDKFDLDLRELIDVSSFGKLLGINVNKTDIGSRALRLCCFLKIMFKLITIDRLDQKFVQIDNTLNLLLKQEILTLTSTQIYKLYMGLNQLVFFLYSN